MLSYFLQTLYGLADLFITGQFYGASVITAVSVGSQVMHMVTVVIVGLSMGATVLIGRAVGAKDEKTLSATIGNTAVLFFAVAVFITLILTLLCKPIVLVMKVPAESAKQAVDYLAVCFWGVPFHVAYNIIASVFGGMGDSKSPLVFIAIACFFNIILDYVFLGALSLGSMGAALATVLAQLMSVIISFIEIRTKNLIKLSKSDLKINRPVLKNILKIGIPVACQDGFIQVSFLLITIIANQRGITVATAVGIVEKIIGFLFLVPSAMRSSISAVASQNIGAGNHENARKALFYGNTISFSLGLCVAVIFQFIAEPFLSLFTKDAAVIRLGAQYIRSYVFDCAFGGIQFGFSGFFCAYGKSIYAFAHNVISIITARISGAYAASVFFPQTLFPMGLAAALGSLLSSIICVLLYVRMKKKVPGGIR